MSVTDIEKLKVVKEIELRVVPIYGRVRGQAFDNGSLMIETFTDSKADAFAELKEWAYKTYDVIPENLEE